MAWTVSYVANTVHGNQRCVQMRCSADGAEANVQSKLKYIDNMLIGYASCATGPNFCYPNSNSSGLATPGTVGCSGFTSGDVLFITVYGR